MKPFGLTGNIGCGKSTVATLLAKLPDVLVVDCDHIAKEIISNKDHRQHVNSILGTHVFIDQKTDFTAIARIIFKEPEIKRALEALIHPLVWANVEERFVAVGDDKLCIAESAIIFETKSEDRFAGIIVTSCNTHEQFRRLRVNRQMDDDQIQARCNEQLPLSVKEQRAQYVIRTDCSMSQLMVRVHHLYHTLTHRGVNHE